MRKERRFLRIISLTAVFMLFGLQAAGSSFAAEESTQPADLQTEAAAANSDAKETDQAQEEKSGEIKEEQKKETQEKPVQPAVKAAKTKTAVTKDAKAKAKASSTLDLADGDLYLAEKTITQGTSSFDHKNTVTVTGTGSTITAKNTAALSY